MNIYIYGNQSFKKEIHETLEHSNIKFKLDNNTVIAEIDDLKELKETILQNPKDIYLIDDEKINKKNSLNKKIKFLTPKDGIDEEFLLDCGIADLSIDSLKELPKYIIRKYDELKSLEPKIQEVKIEEELKPEIELDDELSMLLAKEEPKKQSKSENLDDIFNLDQDLNLDDIEDLVGKIDNKEESITSNEFDDIMNFDNNLGLNNVSFDYDDQEILHKEEKNEYTSENSSKIIEQLDFLGEEVVEEDEDFSDLDKINNDLFGGFDFLNEEIQEGKRKEDVVAEYEKDFVESDEIEEMDAGDFFGRFDFLDEKKQDEKKQEEKIDESLQGDIMNDEFFELDSLNEKDLLEALNCKAEDKSKTQYQNLTEVNKETLSVDSSNVTDLALLISKLLTNKTLEISIKIKD